MAPNSFHPRVIVLVIIAITFIRFLNTQHRLPAIESDPLIPQHIWQVFFGYSPLPRLHENVGSWIATNPGVPYTLLDDHGATALVETYYADRPEILDTFRNLNHRILQADLLRYMILESQGGYYSDVDTTARKPIQVRVS